MDSLLVKFAKQRRADAPVPPTRVQCQGEQMSIATRHTRDSNANKPPGRECHGGRLLFVERLDHVAAAIGGGRSRAGHVDEAHDVLHGSQGVPVVHSLYVPSLRHASSLARGRPAWYHLDRGRVEIRGIPDRKSQAINRPEYTISDAEVSPQPGSEDGDACIRTDLGVILHEKLFGWLV